MAADDGCGRLTAARTFSVTVTDCVDVRLGRAVAAVGTTGCVPVGLESSDDLANLTFHLTYPEGRFAEITITATEVESATIEALSSTDALVTLTARPGQFMRGPGELAQLCFQLAPERPSAFVTVAVQDILGWREDGTPLGNTDGQPGTVVAVGEEPLLEAVFDVNGDPALVVHDLPTTAHRLEKRPTLEASAAWSDVGVEVEIPEGALSAMVAPLAVPDQTQFYRARRVR